MRNYSNFDSYITRLQGDVYPQPLDRKQLEYGEWVINNWLRRVKIRNVLDAGCGQGQFQPAFARLGIDWTGVTLGNDYDICKVRGYNCYQMDYTFLSEFENGKFDCVFARHSLEHSPFPVITLMEWVRISKRYVCVILPNPYGELSQAHTGAYRGRNHYSVMTPDHFLWLAYRAGLTKIKTSINSFEMRFLMRKIKDPFRARMRLQGLDGERFRNYIAKYRPELIEMIYFNYE